MDSGRRAWNAAIVVFWPLSGPFELYYGRIPVEMIVGGSTDETVYTIVSQLIQNY